MGSATALNQSVPLVVVSKASASTRTRIQGAGRSRLGRDLSIQAPSDLAWSPRIEDLQGRRIAEVRGTGSRRILVPGIRGGHSPGLPVRIAAI